MITSVQTTGGFSQYNLAKQNKTQKTRNKSDKDL